MPQYIQAPAKMPMTAMPSEPAAKRPVDVVLMRAVARQEDEFGDAAGEAERLADIVEDDEAGDDGAGAQRNMSGPVMMNGDSCVWS